MTWGPLQTVANISDKFIPGRIYNIGSDQYHDIETLANSIWNYTGAPKTLITYKESEMLTTKVKRVDINLSIKELDHKATVSLEDGVKRTIDWMKDYYRLNHLPRP